MIKNNLKLTPDYFNLMWRKTVTFKYFLSSIRKTLWNFGWMDSLNSLKRHWMHSILYLEAEKLNPTHLIVPRTNIHQANSSAQDLVLVVLWLLKLITLKIKCTHLKSSSHFCMRIIKSSTAWCQELRSFIFHFICWPVLPNCLKSSLMNLMARSINA